MTTPKSYVTTNAWECTVYDQYMILNQQNCAWNSVILCVYVLCLIHISNDIICERTYIIRIICNSDRPAYFLQKTPWRFVQQKTRARMSYSWLDPQHRWQLNYLLGQCFHMAGFGYRYQYSLLAHIIIKEYQTTEALLKNSYATS